jgi:hypothetical protein
VSNGGQAEQQPVRNGENGHDSKFIYRFRIMRHGLPRPLCILMKLNNVADVEKESDVLTVSRSHLGVDAPKKAHPSEQSKEAGDGDHDIEEASPARNFNKELSAFDFNAFDDRYWSKLRALEASEQEIVDEFYDLFQV